jgi:hypothetical protein
MTEIIILVFINIKGYRMELVGHFIWYIPSDWLTSDRVFEQITSTYSTVTDLARLCGLSTSQPRNTAI